MTRFYLQVYGPVFKCAFYRYFTNMNANELLKQKGIDSNKPVLQISREDALMSIMEAVNKYCPSVKIEKMSKEELKSLIDSLGDSIINYHPEDYHQERSTLLNYSDVLQKYGLIDKELEMLDFC